MKQSTTSTQPTRLKKANKKLFTDWHSHTVDFSVSFVRVRYKTVTAAQWCSNSQYQKAKPKPKAPDALHGKRNRESEWERGVLSTQKLNQKTIQEEDPPSHSESVGACWPGACIYIYTNIYVCQCVVNRFERWLLDHLWRFCRNKPKSAMKSFSKGKLKTMHNSEFST